MHLLAGPEFGAENVGAQPREGGFGQRGGGRVRLGQQGTFSINRKNLDILPLSPKPAELSSVSITHSWVSAFPGGGAAGAGAAG